MAEQTNLKITVEAWADIVIKEWIKKVDALNIGVTGDFRAALESFKAHVTTAADGDPEKVKFAFAFYAQFVDWGVGKGTTIMERDTQQSTGQTVRVKKPWFTEVFYKQLSVLRHLMEEKHALQAELFVTRHLEGIEKSGF